VKWHNPREPMNAVLLYTFMVMGVSSLLIAVYVYVIAPFLAYLGAR
jgi:hypothetical protein